MNYGSENEDRDILKIELKRFHDKLSIEGGSEVSGLVVWMSWMSSIGRLKLFEEKDKQCLRHVIFRCLGDAVNFQQVAGNTDLYFKRELKV